MNSRSALISRRQLLAGAGAGAAALLGNRAASTPSRPPGRTIVFTHTTVVNVDAVQDDVALAVAGDKIAAIGPTDTVLRTYPDADVYDGRGKALFPGLINCHAHLAATLERGFNEDFGFPNSARLAVQPGSLLQGEEATLMVTVGALEAHSDGHDDDCRECRRHRPSRRRVGEDRPALRVRRVDPRQRERAGPDVAGRAREAQTPRFSPKLRDEGMQRINDLFTHVARRESGTHQRLPRRRARRDRRRRNC